MDKVNFSPFSEILMEDFIRQSGYISDAFKLFIYDFFNQNTAVLGLEVTAQSVPNMTVYVKPGRIYQSGQQGQLTVNLDPALTVTAAHPSYDRIDRICAQYRELPDMPETRNVMVDTVSRQVTQKTVMTRVAGTIDFMVVSGVAAPVPAAPTVPDGWTSLAQVKVRVATASVLQSDILDERPNLKSLMTHVHSGGIDGVQISYNSLLDRPDLTTLHLRKNITNYAVGDIAYNPALPSYAYLECTVEGITAVTEPTWPVIGSTVTDGSVTWIVRDVRAANPLFDYTGTAKTADLITKFPICDVRALGIFPDGVTDWRDNGKLAAALQYSSTTKIPLKFPPGLYASYFDNYWSNVTCIFEEGAEFAGVIHLAINDASGTPSQNRPSNVKYYGTVTSYARVGCYNCDDVYVERIHIKSDTTKNAQGVKPHGVHIYLDTRNMNIGEIIVDDVGSNQYYGVGLDGSYDYHPKNVHIGRIHVKDSETHGVYLWGDNITVDDILIDGYGAGTQTATLEGATGPESAITHGFWANMTVKSRIGRIEVNQKSGRTTAGEGAYFDAGRIEVGAVVVRGTAGTGITTKAQVETPIVYAGHVEAVNCGGYGINMVNGVLYAHTVLAQANSLDGILIDTGCALKADIVNGVSNVQRQIYAGGNSKINVQHMEATDHTNAAYDAVRIGGAINSKIGTLYITCPTKGLAGGLFANDLNNVHIGQLYTLNCGVDASHCAARIETSTNVTIGGGLLKDGLGQGLRIVTVTDLNINGMTVDGHDTNIAGTALTRVGMMNCRSVNWATAKSNIAAASVATFNCTDMTN